MKAVILTGGKGERLGGISKKIPKPMIKISGKPVLEHNILMCEASGVKDLYLNHRNLKSTKFAVGSMTATRSNSEN